MQFPNNYLLDNKIKSLSARLNFMAKEVNSSRFYVNPEINSENLTYNLSYLLSKIILQLKFVKRGKFEFLSIIKKYNSDNNTNLSFEDFTSINWIMEIGEEVVIPERLRHFIWKMDYDEQNGKHVNIPVALFHQINSLKLYYENYFKDTNLLIKEENLKEIINKYASKEITIEILVKKGIISLHQTPGYYSWGNRSEYVDHLSNEIAATLWKEVGGANAEITDFKRFYTLIRATGVYPNSLINYTPLSSLEQLTSLAAKYLYTIDDLKQSTSEFRKIWLNAHDSFSRSIEFEIPSIQFNYDDQYKFIESVKDASWQFREIFDYQHSRNYCLLLLRLIIENEPKTAVQFQKLLKILQNMDMPILLWNAYQEIPRQYPEVIPYFLNDLNLIPLAFNLIDKIEINELIVPEQQDRDSKYKISKEEVNNLWTEMFDVLLEKIDEVSSESKTIGIALARILSDLAEKVFNSNGHTSTNVTNHVIFKKRYENIIKIIGSKRSSNLRFHNQGINSKIISHYLPTIANHISEKLKNDKSKRHQYLKINSGVFDLGIEMLRLLNVQTLETEISTEIKISCDDLIQSLSQSLDKFYNTIDVEVPTYIDNVVEKTNVSRNEYEFGFEIIDWGYLFLAFEQTDLLDNVNNSVITSLDFLITGDNYDKQNVEQATKLKLYVKSLLLAFLSINKKNNRYEIQALPIQSTLLKLEKWIKEYAIQYSKDNIGNFQIDIFNDRYKSFGYDLYYQHLADLLYKSITHFNPQSQKKFVEEYFKNNNDISRMLNATNTFQSKSLKEIVSKRIQEVDIQDYIDQRIMATDLEYALIEAVNSEAHWHLAEPLIDKLEKHFSRVGKVDINTENFLLEINLLLAFKQKDFAKLMSLEIPQKQYAISGNNTKGERMKRFFIALYKLYNDKEYDEAIKLFKVLSSEDDKNSRYAYHTYRAQTLKALAENVELIKQANEEWNSFVTSLTKEEKTTLAELEEPIASNQLYFMSVTKNWTRFDQTVNRLSNGFLYNQEIIPTIYNSYIERNLSETAFGYLNQARQYLLDSGETISTEIQSLIDNSISLNLLLKLKESFGNIRNLTPSDLIKIIPDILNNKKQLNEFILDEIVQAGRIVIQKIHGIKQITHEDRYNDLLLAILRLRFPVWGWEITDQPRSGSSPTGKSAGEVDLLITAAGNTVALFEALILNKKNKSQTQKHIKKIYSYAKFLDRYYMIVYFTGKPASFNTTWNNYKIDIAATQFPPKFAFDTAKGFEDLSNKFTDVTSLRIAKSTHQSAEVFHVMIDLSR